MLKIRIAIFFFNVLMHGYAWKGELRISQGISSWQGESSSETPGAQILDRQFTSSLHVDAASVLTALHKFHFRKNFYSIKLPVDCMHVCLVLSLLCVPVSIFWNLLAS